MPSFNHSRSILSRPLWRLAVRLFIGCKAVKLFGSTVQVIVQVRIMTGKLGILQKLSLLGNWAPTNKVVTGKKFTDVSSQPAIFGKVSTHLNGKWLFLPRLGLFISVPSMLSMMKVSTWNYHKTTSNAAALILKNRPSVLIVFNSPRVTELGVMSWWYWVKPSQSVLVFLHTQVHHLLTGSFWC